MNTGNSPVYAWVGCLACYNSGQLRGEWFEGTEIPTDHAEWLAVSEQACSIVGHEELWVFDHEGYGPTLAGECSPAEAQAVAETLAELSDHERVPFFAYLSYEGTGPDTLAEHVEAFRDSFEGEFESEREYAEHIVDECGYLVQSNVPDFLARYFDYDSFARDLFMDDVFAVSCYASSGASYLGYPVGSIYVFRRHI